jgi:hypothetical protein
MQWRGGEVLFRISSSSFWQVQAVGWARPAELGALTTTQQGKTNASRQTVPSCRFITASIPVGGHSFLYPDSRYSSATDDKLQIHPIISYYVSTSPK